MAISDISFWRASMFGEKDLRQVLYGELTRMKKEVQSWLADDLLRTSQTEIVDHLVQKYSVPCPVLDREGIQQLPVGEEIVVVPDIAGRPHERQLTVLQIAVPFHGEARVFLLKPSRHSMRDWYTTVAENELRIRWSGPPGDIDAARRRFEEELEAVEKHLGWARELIDPHNAELGALSIRLLAERRAKLLADRGMEAALGFPVRQRQGAPLHAVPVNRPRITPRPRPDGSGPYRPEPELSVGDYEAAIRVIVLFRNGLERSLPTAAKMGEEDIRNQLLFTLNTHFEGQAAGEVFNGHGKTDILIRVDDRNIFIADCKNWKGPKAITKALDEQLLGRYLVWRDSKAALLLFIREGNPGEVIRKAADCIGRHPLCKEKLPSKEDGRHDFVFASAQDDGREIRLAFLPFVLPSAPPSGP
ncbi:hypothetical protein F9278_20095 [Streptomyces phaeolivaceus]|uniref:Uncharacterized protein n=1 Tax=Streptomyces phaeolivaceus TaxID=2653200 RepID=A0A5P8K4C2_9ACTN|nr:hypothetical protein [Streptomyces phaeolivaceus]QFQ98133.1 hypothetical protein F9278_20095 [Streptomyces phaeolivaceus]